MRFSVREALLGAASFVPTLVLEAACRDRLMDLLHVGGPGGIRLTSPWVALAPQAYPGLRG